MLKQNCQTHTAAVAFSIT